MGAFNSPVNCTSRDLEKEAINRFRTLASFMPREWGVGRELNGLSTILCVDVTPSPVDLKTNQELWQELARLLAHSSNYLGLANTVVFKHKESIQLIAKRWESGLSKCWILETELFDFGLIRNGEFELPVADYEMGTEFDSLIGFPRYLKRIKVEPQEVVTRKWVLSEQWSKVKQFFTLGWQKVQKICQRLLSDFKLAW